MTQPARWGDQVAVEVIDGVPYRMYTERPRRVDALFEFAARWGERLHIVHGDRAMTFDDVRHAVIAKAAELSVLGLKPGDRVFVLGWNSPEWIVNFWACLCSGFVPVLANAWWSPTETANGLALMEPALTLADPHAAARMPPGRRRGPWAIDTNPRPGQALPRRDPPSDDENETALIIFTSGTSGQPKAVVLSHRAILARLQMTLHVTRKLPHQIDAAAHDPSLITGPLFHVGTMQGLLRAVIVGDTLVLPRGRFDPAEVAELIECHKIKRWAAVPTMVSRLLDQPDLARRDLSSLKSISIGGAQVHADLLRRIREQLPQVSPRVPTGYGLTENGGQSTASGGTDDPALLGSSGKALPCVEISLLAHPELPNLAPGEGEILLRSPTQMSGYYGLGESPIDAQGWLHTGDLGRLDEHGNLWITGRCKDMIIRGGENIAPAAVERALLSIPGVVEAAVFGMPHPDLGEEVMAVVVVDREVSVAQLQDGLRGQLASFAVPSRWRVQTEPLLTNPTGKVDKPALVALARAELAQAQ
jgi:acyl-CoA synthetase (AMP-forming)/AMP-acid ligase II